MSGPLSIETKSGQPVQYKGATLTPFSQSWRLQIPGLPGGLIWNRPVSVLVTTADSEEQIVPVVDVTRQALWALLGAGLLAWAVYWMIKKLR